MQFNKPPEWGSRFQFPENAKASVVGTKWTVTEKLACEFAEKYDSFIAAEIAREARAAGVSDLTVLNKAAILEAIGKQIPQKPRYRREEDAEGWACPACHMGVTVDHGRIKDTFCSHCGQAIDWEEVNNG